MKDYLEFFGLKDDPFKITPDPKYFFLSESHQEALASLKYLLESEEGFAVITGEPGTGKTLTIRKFLEELPEDVVYAYILFPNLSPEELFEAILEDFGIKSEGETKNRLFAKLRDYLIENRRKGLKTLIIIDEAQNLPEESLEELRILSNLETSDIKLLQIILLGQPELESKLNSEKLRQLNQRITVRAKLKKFTEKETEAYIDFRLSRAGGGNISILPKSYKLVHMYSNGIPRLINVIMERALMSAFVETTHKIKPHHIEKAVESLHTGEHEEQKQGFNKKVAYTLFIILILAIVAFITAYKVPLIEEIQNLKVPEVRTEVQTVDNTAKINEYGLVRVPFLNMRTEPSTDADVIYVLREGDRIKIIEKGPDTWVKAVFSNGNIRIEGWINAKYIEIKEIKE